MSFTHQNDEKVSNNGHSADRSVQKRQEHDEARRDVVQGVVLRVRPVIRHVGHVIHQQHIREVGRSASGDKQPRSHGGSRRMRPEMRRRTNPVRRFVWGFSSNPREYKQQRNELIRLTTVQTGKERAWYRLIPLFFFVPNMRVLKFRKWGTSASRLKVNRNLSVRARSRTRERDGLNFKLWQI